MEELVIPCRVDVVLPVPQKEVLQFANAACLGERHTLSITPCMVHYIQDQYSHPDHLGIGLTSFFFSEPPSACLHTQSIYLSHVLCVQCEYAHTHTHTLTTSLAFTAKGVDFREDLKRKEEESVREPLSRCWALIRRRIAFTVARNSSV